MEPYEIAQKLPENLDFNQVWLFGIKKESTYIFNITKLNKTKSLMWKINIDADFENWTVEQIK